MNGFDDHRELLKYLQNQNVYEQFVDFAEKNGVKETTEEIILARPVVSTYLNALIARFILDNRGYYPIIHDIDPNIQKSLEIFARS
jgi:hypothetical protein